MLSLKLEKKVTTNSIIHDPALPSSFCQQYIFVLSTPICVCALRDKEESQMIICIYWFYCSRRSEILWHHYISKSQLQQGAVQLLYHCQATCWQLWWGWHQGGQLDQGNGDRWGVGEAGVEWGSRGGGREGCQGGELMVALRIEGRQKQGSGSNWPLTISIALLQPGTKNSDRKLWWSYLLNIS